MQIIKLLFAICAFSYFNEDRQNVRSQGASNFVIEEFFRCENVPQQQFKFFLNPKNFNPGLQLVDMNMSLPVPVGNDLVGKTFLEADTQLLSKRNWIHLATIEDEMCRGFARYLGELWFDIERAFGIMPRSCPLPRGSYHATNFTMNFQKLKLQTFPFGKIRVKIEFVPKGRKEIVACLMLIISNMANP